MTELGAVLAGGAQSEICEYGPGRVVKWFRPEFAYIASTEFERTRAICEAGFPVPAIYDLVEIDDRPAIVMERIDGPTLPGPARLGELHLAMHAAPAPRIPYWREVVQREVPANLPDGRALYHGDFHPNNVIRAERGLVVVDWPNALLAHPAMDVARSVVLIRYQGVIPGDENGTKRRVYADAYLEAYRAARTLTDAELAAALSWHAKALLRYEPDNMFAAELRELAAR